MQFYEYLRHCGRVFLAFFQASLAARLTDRGDLLIGTFSIALHQGLGVAFLATVFQHIPQLSGWSFPQVLFVFGAFQVVTGLFYFLFSWTLWFSDVYLISRRLDALLCRPAPVFLQIVAEGVGKSIAELPGIVLGIAILLVATRGMSTRIPLSSAVMFSVLLVAGVAILGGLFTLLALSSFWFRATRSVGEPLLSILDFAQYPLPIYSRWLRVVFTFVVPLGFVAYWPSAWVFGIAPASIVALTFGWALALWTVVALIWRFGLRRYESAGS
jgi:ABC-2 type transport system permease protein